MVGWYPETFRKLHLDYHMKDTILNVAGDLDAEANAELFKKTHIQAVCIFVSDGQGNCVYPTTVGRRHPNLKKDYAGEMASALKRHGLRVMVYVAPALNPIAAKAHPPLQHRKRYCVVKDAFPLQGLCAS